MRARNRNYVILTLIVYSAFIEIIYYMSKLKILLSTILICSIFTSQAQVPDASSKMHSIALNLKNNVTVSLVKFKKDFTKTWDKTFVDFTDNELYLVAGMNFSKQNIKAGGYNSSFNYDLSDYNKNVFKPGYFAGFTVDGKYKHKHAYSFAFSLNKIAAGTNYKDAGSLAPFLGSFSHFKADDQFFTLSMAAHYKKLIPIMDTAKYKLYVIAGPSLDTRLSGQSADNLVNNNYNRFMLRADMGFEFDNNSYYTLFLHYKQGLNSITKSPIKTNMNSVELGVKIKANDLF